MLKCEQLIELLLENGADPMEDRLQEEGNRCHQALLILQDQTFGRIGPDTPEEDLQAAALCWMDLEALLRALDETERKGRLTAETVGGWSRSWSAPENGSGARQIRSCLNRCLGHTGLLYRGAE